MSSQGVAKSGMEGRTAVNANPSKKTESQSKSPSIPSAEGQIDEIAQSQWSCLDRGRKKQAHPPSLGSRRLFLSSPVPLLFVNHSNRIE